MLEKAFICACEWTENDPIAKENLPYDMNVFCVRGGYGRERGQQRYSRKHLYIQIMSDAFDV